MKKALTLLLTLALTAVLAVAVYATDAVSADDTQATDVVATETTEAPAETEAPKAENFTLVMQIGNPEMNVNGVQTEIDPGEGTVPVIQDERTLVPVRAIVEAMGGNVTWDGDTSTATLVLGADTIKLTIGSTTAYLNDVASELDVTPVIINERTMLPIRYIAESFKFNVAWDGDTQSIFILKDAVEVTPAPEATDAPESTEAPTEAPETTDAPESTEAPTEAPETTDAPESTEAPTEAPEATDAPTETTPEPTETVAE